MVRRNEKEVFLDELDELDPSEILWIFFGRFLGFISLDLLLTVEWGLFSIFEVAAP